MILDMSTKSDIKKVGRPKGPEKVGFYRRVPKEQLRAIEKWFDERYGVKVDASRMEHQLVRDTEYGTEAVSLSAREPDIKPISMPEPANKDPMVKAKASEVAALLDDIQRLTDRVASLEMELEECRLLTYDEKMAYWKARALKAEAYAASKNE